VENVDVVVSHSSPPRDRLYRSTRGKHDGTTPWRSSRNWPKPPASVSSLPPMASRTTSVASKKFSGFGTWFFGTEHAEPGMHAEVQSGKPSRIAFLATTPDSFPRRKDDRACWSQFGKHLGKDVETPYSRLGRANLLLSDEIG